MCNRDDEWTRMNGQMTAWMADDNWIQWQHKKQQRTKDIYKLHNDSMDQEQTTRQNLLSSKDPKKNWRGVCFGYCHFNAYLLACTIRSILKLFPRRNSYGRLHKALFDVSSWDAKIGYLRMMEQPGTMEMMHNDEQFDDQYNVEWLMMTDESNSPAQ